MRFPTETTDPLAFHFAVHPEGVADLVRGETRRMTKPPPATMAAGAFLGDVIDIADEGDEKTHVGTRQATRREGENAQRRAVRQAGLSAPMGLSTVVKSP